MDRTEENRQEYKELQCRVKREVSKAKQKAYDELYTRLDTREGEKDLYRLARQRDRDGKDVQQVRVIKDRDGRVLTSEESVQRRWKEYFEELMNEENEREKRVEGVNSVEQKVDKIRKDEVRKALKRMKSGKAVGPDDIPVEVWKCLGEAAVEFLTSLFNRVLENLKKAYDRVPREGLWYCMRKSGVAEKYVREMQDMYERSRTVVRCAVGQTDELKVDVGLHQGPALSPFLFAIVMDQLSEEVHLHTGGTRQVGCPKHLGELTHILYGCESLCKKELLKRANVSTEIQSDVLLPCNFDPALLGSNKTADIAVVWTQINTTRHGLLEISLRGEARPWNNKDGRIKHFPKLSESGNFSILLQKVQPYDRSLYTCELFNGTSCSIGYQEVELQSNQQSEKQQLIWIIAGVLAGAIVLLAVVTTCLLCAKRQRHIVIAETYYENTVSPVPQSDSGNQSIENPIYDTSCQTEAKYSAREEEGISSDTPVYATVRKVKKKVQPYDRSLYTCELFNGTSCSIGYQEVELQSNQQRPGRLAVINGTMNSAVYQKILKENVRPSVYDLKLKGTWVLQQDNDPKHTSKSTSEWLKKNKMKTLEWPSQSPDLNPIEMLWHDLKKVVHARKPSNVAELQQFCKDEWAKIPPQRCNRLIATGTNFLKAKWPFIAGGGAVTLIFLVVLTCLIKRACSNSSNNRVYANSGFDKRNDKKLSEDKHRSPQHSAKAKNEVYVNTPQNHSNIYANSHMQAEDISFNKPH
ncbi:hypothetical protein QTP86_000727 [Hemibagrus guttatus]|nr:hypothetical protein QTP86_000727 [Hemibagrus guttatus]